MSASAETALLSALQQARVRRRAAAAALQAERIAMVAFIDEARNSHWTWDRMAECLGISATAVRRYYDRNKRKVRGG